MPAVDLITLISQLEESHSFSTVQDIVRQRAHFYGYDKIVFFSAHSTLDGIIERIYWIEGDWFDDGENIDAATYIKYCPITRHIIETDRPFFWTKKPDVNREQYRVVAKPKGSGIHGLQIPIFGHLGLEGAVSLGGKAIDSSPRARCELSLLSTYAFLRHVVCLSPQIQTAQHCSLNGKRSAVIDSTGTQTSRYCYSSWCFSQNH